MSRPTPRKAPRIASDDAAIDELARKTAVPRSTVAAIYGAEREHMEREARIRQYLPVIISRRVMQVLRDRELLH